MQVVSCCTVRFVKQYYSGRDGNSDSEVLYSVCKKMYLLPLDKTNVALQYYIVCICDQSMNGVRQERRGVLSPYLIDVYLDELSNHLGSSRVGCTVGNMIVNHLMFADYICQCVQLQCQWAAMSSEYMW